MNAAEEIVKFWYENKGYFVIESLRLKGNKEIDLLAIRFNNLTKVVEDQVHIEVQVSNRFANYNKSVEELATEYHQKKFKSVAEDVVHRLSRDFRMVEVRGKMAVGKNDIFEKYKDIRKKMGVEVIPFETVLREIIDEMKTNIQSNEVIQAIQLIKFQLE